MEDITDLINQFSKCEEPEVKELVDVLKVIKGVSYDSCAGSETAKITSSLNKYTQTIKISRKMGLRADLFKQSDLDDIKRTAKILRKTCGLQVNDIEKIDSQCTSTDTGLAALFSHSSDDNPPFNRIKLQVKFTNFIYRTEDAIIIE